MLLRLLNRRNKASDDALARRYDALYRGGPAFRKLIEEFLPQNPLEPQFVYDLRKKDAPYRSYVGPVIDFFSSQLFAAPFQVRAARNAQTIAPDPFYAVFREDADGEGEDLGAFMKGRFTTAMVQGTSWWVAELPDDGGVPPGDRQEWRDRDLGRATLRPIEPWDVLNWRADRKGRLQWAVTHEAEDRLDDPRQLAELVTETWRIYDLEGVETFKVTYNPKARRPQVDDDIPSQGRRPHGFLRVPLGRLDLGAGLWLMNRAADAQRAHFSSSAALSWAIKRTCYPMAVFKSKDKQSPPKTGAGMLTTIDVEESFEWVSPMGAPFQVLAAEIQAQRTEIYRVSQQMAHALPDAATEYVQSGDAKSEDSAATEICLRAYGLKVCAAIEDLFELVSDARDDVDVKFSVGGLNQFSLADTGCALANAKAARDLGIPSPTLARELASKLASLLLPDASQEVLDAIRAEILKADPTLLVPALLPPPPPAAPAPAQAPLDKAA